jgi:hypothetical protein
LLWHHGLDVTREGGTNCRRTQQDPRPGTSGRGQVTISRSVGAGGLNLRPDVLEIQRGLNRVSATQGGPVPPLDEDGWYGQLTGGAIHKFQRAQFPGWTPDARIDPGQKTIQKLNALLSGEEQKVISGVELAYASIPAALSRVNKAIHRLSVVRASYLSPSSLFFSEKERRAVEWHFKVHKATNPVAQIDRVLGIYTLMRSVLNGANLSRLFQPGREDADAVAYTSLGGYLSKPSQPAPAYAEPEYYIYIPPKRRARSLVIIHELAHYCGGRSGSGMEIDHRATPIPLPRGRSLERGYRSYADMTPDDAYCNTHSYQCYAFPEQSFGKVPANF